MHSYVSLLTSKKYKQTYSELYNWILTNTKKLENNTISTRVFWILNNI